MTETVAVAEAATLKGTVSFSRKLSDNNYGGSEGFMAIQFDIANGDTGEQIIANARSAFTQAKAIVFEQLGVDHTLDDSGVVVEMARRAFQGSVVEPAPKQAPAAAPSTGGSTDEPPFPASTSDAAQKRANKEWAVARHGTHPNEFFDNTGKKASGEFNSKSPDFKHKTSGIGVWFT